MKIGILGGSFDPVHKGHLSIAEDALVNAGLDKVLLVPVSQAALKQGEVAASGEARLEMLRLAVGSLSEEFFFKGRFEVCDLELRRGGVSWSVETARELRRQLVGAELFWIIGADQLAKLHLWRDVRELGEMVEFIAMERPGVEFVERTDLPWLRVRRCAGRRVDVSSTELRRRLVAGESVEGLLPNKVVEYVRGNGLYRGE